MEIFFYYFTWLGSILLLFPAAVIVCIASWKTLQISDFILIFGSLLGVSLITHLLKILFARPRPEVIEAMIVEMPKDLSFPSAHTAQATSFFISLAIIATKFLPVKMSLSIWAIAGFVIVLVGISRVYLKVHYISDVLAGAFVGVVWVLLLSWLIATFIFEGNHAQ